MKKRLLSLLLALALLLSVLPQLSLPTRAEDEPVYSGECGADGNNLTWRFDPETGVLTIEGSGKMKNYSSSSAVPWNDYKAQITAISFPEGLTSVGSFAFSGCTELNSVSLPEDLTNIGNSAFESCLKLSSVIIPEALTRIDCNTFAHCWSLTSITLPKGLTFIGDNAFTYCEELTSITFPERLTSIGEGAFAYCKELTSISFPEGLTTIDDFAFRCTGPSSVTLPASLSSIGKYAFADCSRLKSFFVAEGNQYFCTDEEGVLFDVNKSVLIQYPSGKTGGYVIPEGVTSIGYAAFYECRNLTSIVFPEGISKINGYTFYHCSMLSSINLPEGLTSIDSSAFNKCTGLCSVTFPEGLTEIGSSAFCDCSLLQSITLPAGLTSIGGFAFYACTALTSVSFPKGLTIINASAFRGCTKLTSVAFPEGLREIGSEAFSGCKYLKSITFSPGLTCIDTRAFSLCHKLSSVTLPEGLTTIQEGTFSGCAALTSVILPNSLTSIDDYAFNSCTSLTSINLPAGLTSIGNEAFYRCTSLISIDLPESLTFIDERAFLGCTSLKDIVIPSAIRELEEGTFSGCDSLRNVTILNPYCSIEQSSLPYENEGLTIYGYQFSTAQTYAEEHELNFVSIGMMDELEGYCGEQLFWHYSRPEQKLTITGSGEMTSTPWQGMYIQITALELPEGLTSICDMAFMNCTAPAVHLPDTLSRIGDSAFRNCTGLTEITLPASLKSLGAYAFTGCSALRKMVFLGNQAYVKTLWQGRNWDGMEATPEDLTWSEDGQNMLGPHDQVMIYGPATGIDGDKHTDAVEDWVDAFGSNSQAADDMYPRYYAERFGYSYFPTDAFGDVKPTAYYAVPVAWAVANGITSGTGNGGFSPKKVCTREQVVSFLWKAAGSPEPEATVSPFQDVKPSKYYFKPVLWALERGITSGQSDGSFGVGKACTREQVVSFLWKAIGSPEPEGTESPFTDVKPGKYYYKPVLWAVENGVTSGASASSFGVGKSCTRAQIVTFLYNVYGK